MERLKNETLAIYAQKAGFSEYACEENGGECFQIAGVKVIPVCGVLMKRPSFAEMMQGACCIDEIACDIDEAEADGTVQAVMFWFDTPGGVVTGIPELAAKIRAMKKPTAAFTDKTCASAGMWLASQCVVVMATPSSRVGSCGVYHLVAENSGQLASEGVKVNEFVRGKFKTTGADYRPVTSDESALLQARVDRVAVKFYADVKDARPQVDEMVFETADIYDGEQALAVGLIDEIVMDSNEAARNLIEMSISI